MMEHGITWITCGQRGGHHETESTTWLHTDTCTCTETFSHWQTFSLSLTESSVFRANKTEPCLKELGGFFLCFQAPGVWSYTSMWWATTARLWTPILHTSQQKFSRVPGVPLALISGSTAGKTWSDVLVGPLPKQPQSQSQSQVVRVVTSYKSPVTSHNNHNQIKIHIIRIVATCKSQLHCSQFSQMLKFRIRTSHCRTHMFSPGWNEE